MNQDNSNSAVSEWIMLGTLALMFVASAVCWPFAPERIPVHWNLAGEADRWGSRLEGLLLLPLITAGLYVLLRIMPRFDPKRENYAQFAGTYRIIRLATQIVMVVIHLAVIAMVMGVPVNMGWLVPLVTGTMLIVLGNYMSKIRPNWFVGIRTPWTMTSKQSWVKTHRQSRWVFVVSGCLTILTGLTASRSALIVMLVSILGGTAWLVIYSYWVWRNDTERVSALETSPAGENSSTDQSPIQ